MSHRWVFLVGLSLLVAVVPAHADEHGSTVVAGANSFGVHQVSNSPGSTTPGSADGPEAVGTSGSGQATVVVSKPTCESVRLSDCVAAPMCSLPDGTVLMFFDGQVHENLGPTQPCPKDVEGAPAVSLAALVLRAFQRVPLPEPQLSIQPPKGKTLVGLETIFSTTAEPFTRTLTLLGRQVQLKIQPSSFTWLHGDTTTQSTNWPGKPWSNDQPDIDTYITHLYEHTANVRPGVEVTWSADYRIGNGPWQQVNGTVSRTSPRATLQILEGEPVLHGY